MGIGLCALSATLAGAEGPGPTANPALPVGTTRVPSPRHKLFPGQ